MFASIAAPAQRLVVLRSSFFNDGQAADWSLQLHRTYRSYGCYSQTSAHRSSRGSSQPSLQCKCMYVDTFIPYHMYIYVCKYINSLWYSHPLLCRSSNYFRSYSSTVKRWLKLAATPHLPVYWLLFAVDAAAVQPRFFTAILALNGLAACMYVCMYVQYVCSML